ncbi:MAG: membrane protein insertion efficiency factor YidD [Actinomycetota bacterium]
MIRRIAWAIGLPVRLLLVGLLLLYRHTVGPMVSGRCRFHPSCSAYALEAVRVHGALKGSALAGWRVLRCSPLSDGGPDPVPPAGRWTPPSQEYERIIRGKA